MERNVSIWRKWLTLLLVIVMVSASYPIIRPGLDLPEASASADSSEGNVTEFSDVEDSILINFTEAGSEYVYIDLMKTYNVIPPTSFDVTGNELVVNTTLNLSAFYVEDFSSYGNLVLSNDDLYLSNNTTMGYVNSTMITFEGNIDSISASVSCSDPNASYYTIYVSDNNFTSANNITSGTADLAADSSNLRYNITILPNQEDFVIYSVVLYISLKSYPSNIDIGILADVDVGTWPGELIDTFQFNDFEESINEYVSQHLFDDGEPNILVPLKVSSTTIGQCNLSNLLIPWNTIDLEIDNVDVVGGSTHEEGEVVTFNVTVENLNQSSGEFYIGLYRDTYGSENLLVSNFSDIDGGETLYVELYWFTLNFAGDYNLFVKVDCYDDLYEVEESNNFYDSIGFVNIIGHQNPDEDYDYNLVALEILPDSTIYYTGEHVKIIYKVWNGGWEGIDIQDGCTIRIERNETIVYDDDLSFYPDQTRTSYLYWDTAGYSGTYNFTMWCDPDGNITEFEEDDNIISCEVTVLQIPPAQMIYQDDYNASNWTFVDNSSVLDGAPPESGSSYWQTTEDVSGSANMTIPYIDLYEYDGMDAEFSEYTMTFWANHSLGTQQNIGYLYLAYNGSEDYTELMNFTGLSGNATGSEWELYDVNLTSFVESNYSRDNSTLRFSVELNDSETCYWYIDNISINFLYWNGSWENGYNEFFWGCWTYVNWEYHEAITQTGNDWCEKIVDEVQCWWNGNNTTGHYENNVDALLISPRIYLPQYSPDYADYILNFTCKWDLLDDDFVEFFIINTSLDKGVVFEVFQGEEEDWTNQTYNISAYAGQCIFLCFRMVSTASGVDEGFFLDPIDARNIDYNKGVELGAHKLYVTNDKRSNTLWSGATSAQHHFWLLEPPTKKFIYNIIADESILDWKNRVIITLPISLQKDGASRPGKHNTEITVQLLNPNSALLQTLEWNGKTTYETPSYYKNQISRTISSYSENIEFKTPQKFTIPKNKATGGKYLIGYLKVSVHDKRWISDYKDYFPPRTPFQQRFTNTRLQWDNEIVYRIPIYLTMKSPDVRFSFWHTIGEHRIWNPGANNRWQPRFLYANWGPEFVAIPQFDFLGRIDFRAVENGDWSGVANRWRCNAQIIWEVFSISQNRWCEQYRRNMRIDFNDPRGTLDQIATRRITFTNSRFPAELEYHDLRLRFSFWGRYQYRAFGWWWTHFEVTQQNARQYTLLWEIPTELTMQDTFNVNHKTIPPQVLSVTIN